MVTGLAFVALIVAPVHAANWAQVVGEQQQNIVTPARPSFGPRWGHSAVSRSVDSGDAEVLEEMIVLGGESVESHYQNKKIVSHTIAGVHYDGSRGYRNDVNVATSYRWLRYRDEIERTKYNKGVPKVEGQMDWSVRNQGHVPPADHSYDEWITCDYDAWEDTYRNPADGKERYTNPHGKRYGEESRYERGAYECDPAASYAEPATFFVRGACPLDAHCTMWSPRRGHATVVQAGVLIVMGGRAREHRRMRREESVGGVLASDRPMANDKFYSAWREKTVLKNDVWTSTDGGTSWELANPGCRVPQRDLVHAAKPVVATKVRGKAQRTEGPRDGVGLRSPVRPGLPPFDPPYGSERVRSSLPPSLPPSNTQKTNFFFVFLVCHVDCTHTQTPHSPCFYGRCYYLFCF